MYLWIKAFHLIAAISWMVGLLYLPRLYVYHAMVEPGSARAETLALMERRLLKAIMNPAMIVTFGLGLWMIHLNPGLIEQNWFLAKASLVFLLAGVHGKLAKMRKGLESGEDIRSDRYYRVWNEVPTVFLIAIVILVIVQPF
jgi:putative membrane protein